MSGIYIHIPFCRQICHYCDFHHSASLARKDEMLATIARELEARQGEIEPGSVKTLYFGGGTPSVCTPEEIRELIDLVRRLWEVKAFEEVTLEANPDDLTPSYLAAIRAAGVDRLSIGIQSFHDDHLKQMNRRHTATQAVQVVRDAQETGFDNLTIDLMYGLPWMTSQEWEENLKQAVRLEVQHISAYHLTVEPRTVFGKKGLEAVTEQVSQHHFDRLRAFLCGAGFEHYEISNFAKPGYRARHNSLYWKGEPYLGVGPSAHSYDGQNRRSWNVSNNNHYLDGLPPEAEMLTSAELLHEYLMTRLRTADGMDYEYMKRIFGVADSVRIARKCEDFITAGQMRRTAHGVAIRPEHFLVSDHLISQLFS